MRAELDGETRPVMRYRRGVIWCPFCDRSRQTEGMEMWCDACHARFIDETQGAETAAPVQRRRGRPRRMVEQEPEGEGIVDLEAGDAVL